MFCPHCGKEVEQEQLLCPFCGESLGTDIHPEVQSAPPAKRRTETAAMMLLAALSVIVVALVVAIFFFWRTWLPPKAAEAPAQPASSVMNSNGEPEPGTALKPSKKQEPDTELQEPVMTSQEIAGLSQSALCLYIYDEYGSYIASGSGFLLFSDDLVMTNFHVVAGASFVEAIAQDGTDFWAETVVYADENADLALLQLEEPTGLPVLRLGDAASVTVGDRVYAMGNPLDVGFTVSDGMLSAIRQDADYTDFQFTAPISPGSSGGPLLNDRGQVIGVVYATYETGQNLNLAIPAWELEGIDQAQAPMDLYTFSWRYRSYGNSFENYSAQNAHFAENETDCFFCSDFDQTILHIPGEGDTLDTGLQGCWLSCYRDMLYFLPPEGDAVCVYDPATGAVTENLLEDYPLRAQVTGIRKLFVTDCGFTLIYATGNDACSLLQLDFDGAILGTLADRDYAGAILVEGLEAAIPLPETQAVRYIPLEDPVSWYDVSVDFPIGMRLTYGGGSWLYATSQEAADQVVAFDMYGDDVSHMLTLEGWDQGPLAVHWDYLYYTGEGVRRIPAGGGAPELIDSSKGLLDLNFTSYDCLYGPSSDPNVVWFSLDLLDLPS